MEYRKVVTLIIALFASLCATADIPLRARFLSSVNGLGTNYVRSIVQDSKGYVWIGSTDGLIRYDGYNAMILMPSDAPNRRLMRDIRIQDLRLWQDRYLLLRLRGNQYSCYDITADRFIEFKGSYEAAFRRQQTIRRPGGFPMETHLAKDNRDNTIGWTPQGDIWHVDAKTQALTHISGVYSDNLYRLNGNPRYTVLTDKDGLIWISTYGNGLFVHDRKTGQTTHYLKATEMTAPIETNYLMGIYEDRAGNIWALQENMGVAIISKKTSTSESVFFANPEDMGHINSIHLLKRVGDVVYAGNRYNSLYVADSQLKNMHPTSHYNDDVVAVCKGADGSLWLGTRKSGVFNNDRQYSHDANQPSSLSKGKISDIFCDARGRIWVSVFDGAVDMAEPDGNGGYRFRHFFQGKDAIGQPRQMISDHHGYIWLSAGDGLYLFQPDKLARNPKAYRHLIIHKGHPQLDEIHCIYEDSHKNILAGTQGSGLVLLDNSKEGDPHVKRIFTTEDGLPSNNIQQLIEDAAGNIWIGTDNGLARFSPKEQTFVSLMPSDTRPGNMFIENAACKLDNGRLAFGSRHGIAIIDPNSLPSQHSPFSLCISDIYINGISIHDQENSDAASLLGQNEPVRLDYNQNSLTFYFSDFDYTQRQNSRYSYRLAGYEREWSPLSPVNFASYKNLPPGKYTMEVRSLDANGEWNNVTTTLPIVINPPLWSTWWAYLIYIILLAALGWFVWRYFKRTNDLKNRIKVETQLTEFKLRFFTNISHEFRTPLTIIRGAMERMAAVGDIPGDMKQPVNTMSKSVDRMMRLVNQLLEFRKMQNDKLQLALEETDVIAFVKNIFMTFMQTAENKRISYNFLPFAHEYFMFVDKNYLDKIVYNLLSNSFKYTMSQHSITLRITMDNDSKQIAIVVEDTGIGVPKEKQEDLFTRFNQSVYTQNSIGIGLHLVYELVRVHHGNIRFDENPQGGAIFTVTLPTDRNCYEERDFLRPSPLTPQTSPLAINEYRELAPEPLNDRRVLIVEDDAGILEYMQSELSRYFIIDTASNGQEALDQLNAEDSPRPDLIISDVVMPIMSGFELTRRVRADKETTDIPIILLTAITAEEKKVKGFDSGADAYLEKPFSMKVLIATCRQLISQRDHIRMKYAKAVNTKATVSDIIIDTQDQRMRKRLDSWLDNHLADSDLNIDTFAQKMGYGRTTFYKKVKQLTGKTPNDYIKELRMQRATELLKDDTQTIAQVAYQVGIDDPYYFSKLFKSYYGISPSQYRKGETPTLVPCDSPAQ
ncbi:MAG: response regulator [Prevotella sp.]|nr:response regulator [Prevotella sp.]